MSPREIENLSSAVLSAYDKGGDPFTAADTFVTALIKAGVIKPKQELAAQAKLYQAAEVEQSSRYLLVDALGQVAHNNLEPQF